MNITVVWVIIAICTITFCIGLFKAASDIEKDLVEESFSDIKKDIEYLKAKIVDIERRLNKMEQEIENLMVIDDWWKEKKCKDEEYYNDAPDWYEED